MKKDYYWLDPLRAISAILVLLVHTRCVVFSTYDSLCSDSQNIFTIIFFLLCGLGGFSVCMFYILSGFLIGGKTIQGISSNKVSPGRFAIKRIFRIGVPLFGAVMLTFCVNLVLNIYNNPIDIIGQFIGLQCILVSDYGGVFWTLPYEIWFYVLMFCVICFAARKHTLLGVILFSCTLIAFSQLLPQYLYILCLGILCYHLKDIRFSPKMIVIFWILIVMVFILYLLVNINSLSEILSYYLRGIRLNSGIIQLILFTLISVVLSQYVSVPPSSKVGQIINKLGEKISVFSYSLFLTHYQVLKLYIAYGEEMHTVNLYSLGIFIGLCTISVIVAFVFYLIFERNTQKIQNFFVTKFS